MTLTAAASPYTGGTTIEPGVTVTVEPGVEIRLGYGTPIIVNGTLSAAGTAEDPIVFTAETEGGYFNWQGLAFNPGSNASVLDRVEVRYAGRAGSPAITINKSSPTIEHSTITKSGYGAISIPEGGAPEIAHNAILEGGSFSAIYYSSNESSSGEVSIHDNLIEGNGGYGISIYESGPVTAGSVGGNTVRNNGGVAITYGGDEFPTDLDENTLEGNSGNAIWISGTLSKSTTWTDHGYPFVISNGNFTIGSGATLNIGPGFTVKSDSWWAIVANGTLKAEGTAEEPIVLTSNTSFNWPGLVFNPGSSASVLDQVEVRRAGTYNGSAVTIDNASPTVRNSRIKGSDNYGIFVKHGGAPDIDSNRVENSVNSGIFYGESGEYLGAIDIHDNLLERNGGSAAIYINSNSGISAGGLGGNTIRESSASAGIYFSGGAIPSDITANKLVGNKSNNIDVSGTVTQSGTWADPWGPITVGSLTIASGVTLTVEPGVAFAGGEFMIDGTLKAEGTAEEPVLFNSVGASQWKGLTFEAGSSASVLDHVEVVNGGYFSGGKAITINGSSPRITNSAIRQSSYDGIYVTSGSPTIEGNRFRANPRALAYAGEGKISAPNNDWGCETGEPKPSGCGDEVGSNVLWEPSTNLPDPIRPCVAGSKQPGPGLDCLLYRYAPELKYDNQESFLANSAAEITDNWGTEAGLWEEGGGGPYTNKLIRSIALLDMDLAYSRPASGAGFRLTLDSLGTSYPGGGSATGEDRLDETGENYAEDDHNLVAKGYLNRSYGRVVKGAGGRIWLQYWYFYYYNNMETGEWELKQGGLHEGDWEEVQISLDEDFEPETVIFSAHGEGSSCEFENLEKASVSEGPVVYVALDSHANYPEAGQYSLISIGSETLVHDHANGKGPAITPSVEVIGQDPPSWLEWPGRWGNSRGGVIPGQAESPTGPKQNSGWDPDDFAEGAAGCEENYDGESEWERSQAANASPVAAPTVGLTTFEGRHPTVSYRLPDGGRKESGSRLILSVKERDSDLPPLTKTVKGPKATGVTTLPFKLNPKKEVVILASVLDRHGNRSPVVRQVSSGR
jgi:Right handed beta helix region/Vacuolar protein sorting-associated protein 62